MKSDRVALRKALPFLRWWPHVTKGSTKSDLIAGLTGALIVLPQGVAFATIAGLPPEFGLYAAMVPAVIAALFGSSWHLVTGPTTAISIVVFASISPLATPGTTEYINLVLTLTFLTGVFQLIMGLVRMGALVNFISHTVVIGFTAGAAILIAVSQVSHFLGIDLERGLHVYEVLQQVVVQFDRINPYVATVGLVTLASGIVMRRFAPRLFMIIAMVVGSITAVVLNRYAGGEGVTHIETVGALGASLPPLSFPDFSLEAIRQVAFPALIVTTLALTEAVSISRAIALKSGQRLDANQEFIGQGLSNLVGAFFSSYASSGSFNRSGVNYAAGARSPLAAVFSSAFLVLVLAVVAPFAAYLPTPAMAGVLFLVAYGLIDFRHIGSILRTSRQETAVLALTFFGTLLDLEKGVFAGVVLSLVLYLYRTSRPTVVPVVPDEDPASYYFVPAQGRSECPQYKMIRIHGSIFFGAAHHVQGVLNEIDEVDPKQKHVLLVARSVNFVDVSGAEMLAKEARRRREMGGGLYFYRLQDHVREFLAQDEYSRDIQEREIFPTKSHPIDSVYQRLDSDICRDCTARIFPQCHLKLPNGEPRRDRVNADTHELPVEDGKE
jgi:SulP family sulfate permease